MLTFSCLWHHGDGNNFMSVIKSWALQAVAHVWFVFVDASRYRPSPDRRMAWIFDSGPLI